MSSTKKFNSRTAVAIVIANMIGTGVFTSLGFQLLEIRSPFVILMLWLVGGLIALCGALCYAELGTTLPRSGGEYRFLTEIYHPAAGFASGWVSATVGFAAPTALAAITFGAYLHSIFPSVPRVGSAVVLVTVTGVVHAINHQASGRFQQTFTALKVALIVLFCAGALYSVPAVQPVTFLPGVDDGKVIFSSVFAVALIYVNYAYTGWNVATYISSELENPQRTLPLVLIAGAAIVLLLYLMLNSVFLLVAPMDAMAGELQIGYVAATFAFDQEGAQIMGLILSALLISTVSAMVLAGPRVLQAIGQDFSGLSLLAKTNRDAVPIVAIGVQVTLTLLMVLVSSFQSILLFAGFVLALNTFFAVLGVFILRIRKPELFGQFRIPGYPLPPLIYLGLTGWTMLFILRSHPQEGAWALALVATGLLLYLLTTRLGARMAANREPQ